jgi:hypothetical protein
LHAGLRVPFPPKLRAQTIEIIGIFDEDNDVLGGETVLPRIHAGADFFLFGLRTGARFALARLAAICLDDVLLPISENH